MRILLVLIILFGLKITSALAASEKASGEQACKLAKTIHLSWERTKLQARVETTSQIGASDTVNASKAEEDLLKEAKKILAKITSDQSDQIQGFLFGKLDHQSLYKELKPIVKDLRGPAGKEVRLDSCSATDCKFTLIEKSGKSKKHDRTVSLAITTSATVPNGSLVTIYVGQICKI